MILINCQVKVIKDSKEAIKFLRENHIQGMCSSSLKLGLFHNGKLVSILTFNNTRSQNKINSDEWKINRFCDKLDTNVVDGTSKLFKFFINNYGVSRVVGFSNSDWDLDYVYKKLGFKEVNKVNPDYKYVVEGSRINKSKYRKLLSNVRNSKKGITKIWDCGGIKFENIF